MELNPSTARSKTTKKMRVLDLACGKGGDLGKWILHERGLSNYVGVDVARGSLKDAAIRARGVNRHKLPNCTFTCADLGSDVPGRPKSTRTRKLQKLSSWSFATDTDKNNDPVFNMVPGGGISEHDSFDVVSIQFAIHYMMSTRDRARRFFQTVSQLLDVGGNLIATTIDARVVLDKLMSLGCHYHFDNHDAHPDIQSWKEQQGATVVVGNGVCQLAFDTPVLKKIFDRGQKKKEEDLFGLEYTFRLVEGSDHAAGVGEAVDLPEWLTPIPVLEKLAEEAGLELEYAMNFHEYYTTRKDSSAFPKAHIALYNMKVLNRTGSISAQEWDVSRMYLAVKFRKVRETKMNLDDMYGQDDDDNDDDEDEQELDMSSPAVMQKVPMALMKAKRAVGAEQWKALDSDEKNRYMKVELLKMLSSS